MDTARAVILRHCRSGACFALALACAPFAASVPARAACDLEAGPTGRVAQVLDGETVVLEDGKTVRLIGALAPRTPDWWRKAEPWPPADRARAVLADLVAGAEVTLHYGGRRQDRHGRHLAQLFVTRGPERLWVQSALVERGLARAYSFQGNRACARRLQAREESARAARLGIWWRKTYAPAAAGEPKRLFSRLHSFQIVSGTVYAVTATKRWTFVNFGADWKRDFTVAIRAGDRRLFAGSDVPLDALEGRRIRVRGWIESWNGPVVKVTHPEEIEILDAPAAKTVPDAQNPAPKTPGSVEL